MSYQEKRTIVNIVFGVLILAAYCVYVFGAYQAHVAAPDDLKFFAAAMLKFIGIGVVVTIVVQVIFHILLSVAIAVKERDHDGKKIEKAVEAAVVEDEMDKLIGHKSARFGYAIAGAGFIASLITLMLDYPAALMLNIIFLSFGAGSLAEGALSLYYYRAGIRNG